MQLLKNILFLQVLWETRSWVVRMEVVPFATCCSRVPKVHFNRFLVDDLPVFTCLVQSELQHCFGEDGIAEGMGVTQTVSKGGSRGHASRPKCVSQQ